MSAVLVGAPRLPARFWSKVELGPKPDERPELGECWVWVGADRGNGYGAFKVQVDGRKTVVSAHRYGYLALAGPTDLALDHLCRVRNCVNPAHLEPVTLTENNLRSAIVVTTINAAKTHCPRRHPYDAVNTRINPKGARCCRACQREKRAEARMARAAA